MSRTELHIATGFSLPLEAVTQSIAILAKRRAGKSYTARRFTEQLVQAQLQVVIVDPKGDWWGIRSAADGKSPGLPITILGGAHGDLPLEVGSGELVAKLVVFECVSVLLDLSHFRKSEVARFMAEFLESFYRLKAQEQYRSPVMLVVDEADAIAPQKPFKGEERMLGAIEDIVRRGGQRGVGCLLISQRSAVLNKNVLTQVNLLVPLRTIAPQDLEAMNAWIDVHGTIEQRKMLMESLPSLPIGDAWFWAPGWPDEDGIFKRVHVLPIETFDSGATPKPGEKRIEPKNLADVDLEALRRQMAATIEKAKADDPKELRRQLAELEKQLAAKPAASAAAPAKEIPTERIQKEFERGVQAERRRIGQEIGKLLKGVRAELAAILPLRVAVDGPQGKYGMEISDQTIRYLDAALEMLAKSAPMPAMLAPAATPRSVHTPPASPALFRASAGRGARESSNGNISGPEQRVLNGLAELEALGISEAERSQVALLADYTHVNSKGFTNAIGALRTAGLITYPGDGKIAITAEGRAAANPTDRPLTTADLQERIIRLLDGPCERVLRTLISVYPHAIDRHALADFAKYGHVNSKGFTNAIGRLRSLGLIDYHSHGQVVALPILFLAGRR